YAAWQHVPVVDAIFFGIKPAVLAIVVEAVIRIGKRALRGPAHVAIAAAAFVAILFFAVPFPLIVLGAGAIGAWGSRARPEWFAPRGARAEEEPELAHVRPS